MKRLIKGISFAVIAGVLAVAVTTSVSAQEPVPCDLARRQFSTDDCATPCTQFCSCNICPPVIIT